MCVCFSVAPKTKHIDVRHTKHTNPIIRKLKSVQWVLFMMCATLLEPNQHAQCSTPSSVRARERQIRAPKKGILGVRSRGSYWDNVTVYPYNRYIRSTNPVVRHVMSLACTLKRMRANQHAPKHATTQPLHDSNLKYARPSTKSRHIKGLTVGCSYWDNVTVYRYNRHTRSTNMNVRCSSIFLRTLILMLV